MPRARGHLRCSAAARSPCCEPFSSSGSPPSAARSPTSPISARSSWCAGSGSTIAATRIPSRCASSRPPPRAARSASDSGSRAGLPGAFAAWLAFTMPSAVALVLFAYGVEALGAGLVAGLAPRTESSRGGGRRPGGVGHGEEPLSRCAAFHAGGRRGDPRDAVAGFGRDRWRRSRLAPSSVACFSVPAATTRAWKSGLRSAKARARSPSGCSSSRLPACRPPPRSTRAGRSRGSTASTALAPSSSVAATSCSRCCNRRSSRRDGSRTTSSLPVTAPLRRYRDRSSPSPRISAR